MIESETEQVERARFGLRPLVVALAIAGAGGAAALFILLSGGSSLDTSEPLEPSRSSAAASLPGLSSTSSRAVLPGPPDSAASPELAQDAPPEEILRALLSEGGPPWDEMTPDAQRQHLHAVGRAQLRQFMILDEDREQVKALGRLPSLDAIAELKGVDLDPAEKARIEAAVAPRYASQVEPLVPGILEEINDLILVQWDQGGYDSIDEQGQTVQRGMSDYPKGELQMQGMFRCFGTPYEVSFVFNSSAYPTLQASLERIALLKAQMRDEVFEMIQ